MKAMKLFIAAWFVLSILISTNPIGAALVTSLPGGTVIPMPVIEYFGSGPQSFGPGITWSSTNASNQGGSVFGYTGPYNFGSNGEWNRDLGPMAGLNSDYYFDGVTDTMTFAFSTPVNAVGGFLNYVPDFPTTPNIIAVYDSSHTLIESATLTFLTNDGTNSGSFYGFQEASDIIKYFTLTDRYIAITNLTISPVPLPSALLLLGVGLFRLAAYGRRRMKG